MNFSCIIACFNGENYLKEAVESVISQLMFNDELIIVNDGSTDNTQAIISSYKDSRIIPIHLSKNIGFSSARNEGLKIASKEYISFLDHDDLWPLDRQKLIIDTLNKNPDAGLVYGKIEQFFSVLNSVLNANWLAARISSMVHCKVRSSPLFNCSILLESISKPITLCFEDNAKAKGRPT
jgi:glycosyltransferase involved in cell wall biosynthesis